MKIEKVNPSEVLYIKLGDGGMWENECIFEKNTIKLSYHSVSHGNCLNNDWNTVRKDFEQYNNDSGVITRHINQIKKFYQKKEDVMWITFHYNTLWWCFTNPQIIYEEKTGFKSRNVIGKWRCETIN